jgi:hypothetical protein
MTHSNEQRWRGWPHQSGFRYLHAASGWLCDRKIASPSDRGCGCQRASEFTPASADTGDTACRAIARHDAPRVIGSLAGWSCAHGEDTQRFLAKAARSHRRRLVPGMLPCSRRPPSWRQPEILRNGLWYPVAVAVMTTVVGGLFLHDTRASTSRWGLASKLLNTLDPVRGEACQIADGVTWMPGD